MTMVLTMVLVVMVFLLLPESKPCRAVIKVQKGDDDSQEGSKSEANDETNLDVVIPRRIIRELSLDMLRCVLASLTA
jgi:hypothetical protein